jgi:hypothetical protein
VVPQSLVWTFLLIWLTTDRGWPAGSAELMITSVQLCGAAGRIVAGRWSDAVGSRLHHVRVLTRVDRSAGCACGGRRDRDRVRGHGVRQRLALTAIARVAGPIWSRRTLGSRTPVGCFTGGLVQPAFGALITAFGFPAAFAVGALFALAAVPVVPMHADPVRTNVGDPVGPAQQILAASHSAVYGEHQANSTWPIDV